MASDTFSNYIAEVRAQLHETSTTNTFWSQTLLQQLFNESYMRRVGQLVMAYEGNFRLVAITNIIANQARYTWPAGFERLMKLEIVRPTDGRTIPLRRWERHEATNIPPVAGDESYFPTFRPVDQGFVLEPTPDSGAASATILADFDETDPATDATYDVSTDAALSTNTVNFREGTASVQIDKTGVTEAFADLIRQSFGTISLSGSPSIDVFIPTITPLTASDNVEIHVGDASLTNSNQYNFTVTAAGWRQLTISNLGAPDATTGTGADLDAITEFKVRFNLDAVGTTANGLLVDNFQQPGTGGSAVVSQLRIEYFGTPTKLENDGDLLMEDFPVMFDRLLILDTVLAALDTEAFIENGSVRSVLRRRNELEFDWERYIDNRMVMAQQIRPFIGPYEDA